MDYSSAISRIARSAHVLMILLTEKTIQELQRIERNGGGADLDVRRLGLSNGVALPY